MYKRKSGDYRRIRYLARVMAGLSLSKKIKPSYAIELFRKKVPMMNQNT